MSDVRLAVEEDIPAIVKMGKEFHAMSPHVGMGEYDEAAIERLLIYLIENDQGVVLWNGTGVIGGLMAPVYFNPDKMMLEEAFWFARKGGRELLKEFQAKAREMGADFVLLSTLVNDFAPVVDRIVTRMGYAPIERRWLKELT